MARGEKMDGILNPLIAGLRKMEEKLQCAVCSRLVQEPKLLPCNHVFCRNCLMNVKITHCPQCNSKILSKDIMEGSYIKEMVEIYNDLNAAKRDINMNILSLLNASNEESELNDPLLVPPGFKRLKRSREEGPPNVDKSDLNEKNNLEKNKIGKNLIGPFNKEQKKNLPKVPIGLFDDECAFCHSFRTTKVTGEMLYYQKGKLISSEEADKSTSKVIYVHETCFEWTPKIYYKGERVQNLENEVKRANRLTCEKCKRKGAALGCYSERCEKSFHATCALQIPHCRWDEENYNMLCPVHVHEKLKCDEIGKTDSHMKETNDMDCSEEPVEKEKAPAQQSVQKEKAPAQQSVQKENVPAQQNVQKEKAPAQQNVQKENVPAQQTVQKETIQTETSVQNKKNKFVLFCSALSEHEKDLVNEFATQNGAIIIDRWRNDATHIITSDSTTFSCRRIRRTNEVMMAILHGIWIVTIEWIEACLENESLVSEESFEVNEDFYGTFDGPRKGRMRVAQKAPNLFARLGFSLSAHLPQNKKTLVEDLVTAGGGKITNKDGSFSLLDSSAKRRVLTNYLVYDVNPHGSSERNKEFLEFGEKDECSRLVSYSRVLEAVGGFDSEILNKEWYQDS
ncbi:hypothetical protein LUZ60_010971 [Juncus effusus]|nr:hypothetical protein LUZ60_010971 [Juncus effusus]